MQAILVSTHHDEREIWTFVLRHAGMSVASTTDLKRVTAKWAERPADVVVVVQYHEEGLAEAVNAVRALTHVPLLLLVNPLPEEQLCRLLEGGVDLVLFRPVSPRVLAQYVRVLLRRARTGSTLALPKLELEEICLHPSTRTVEVTGREPQRLTQLEFRLLYILMINRGQVIPTEVIIERVWGYTGEGNRDLVRGLISRLRRKIEPQPNEPRFILTIPGTGYCFVLEEG